MIFILFLSSTLHFYTTISTTIHMTSSLRMNTIALWTTIVFLLLLIHWYFIWIIISIPIFIINTTIFKLIFFSVNIIPIGIVILITNTIIIFYLIDIDVIIVSKIQLFVLIIVMIIWRWCCSLFLLFIIIIQFFLYKFLYPFHFIIIFT